jgi:phosphatidylglycerol---prolipoprotein diacylglyceryl transferase
MPSSFQIGPLTVHFYGIIIMLGVVAAAWLAQWNANRQGQDGNRVWDMLLWVLVAGIIGARIWHILTPMPDLVAQGVTTGYYLTHPLAAIAIWNGGLGIPGAVIGGAAALYFYTRRHRLSFLAWADILAPSVALGQAIGRWGNFFNQELYGSPTNLPWAIYIDPQHRLSGYQSQAFYHPLFLYESLWDLGNMALLLWLGRHAKSHLRQGEIFLIYAGVYAVGRFLLEFLRLDASEVAGINANQALMLGVMIVAALVLFWLHRPGRSTPAEQRSKAD